MKIQTRLNASIFIILFFLSNVSHIFGSSQIIKAKSIAMNGSAKYPDGFTHFDYVNPNAPKGGSVRLNSIGTYDSFNNLISNPLIRNAS